MQMAEPERAECESRLSSRVESRLMRVWALDTWGNAHPSDVTNASILHVKCRRLSDRSSVDLRSAVRRFIKLKLSYKRAALTA
jgi:hypothetical protein